MESVADLHCIVLLVDWSFGSLLWQPLSGVDFFADLERSSVEVVHLLRTSKQHLFLEIFCVERDGQLFTVDLLFLLLLPANVVQAIVFTKPQRFLFFAFAFCISLLL